jgi:thioredoxin
MAKEKIKTEKRAIKIVDGFITVEIVRRKRQPWDKAKVRNSLRILKRRKKAKMAEWSEGLPPIIRDRLAKIGKVSSEEKERITERERLDSLLKEFYKGFLDSEGLYQELKEYQEQGKQFLLREAQEKLESSFKKKASLIKFEEKSDGKLNVELLKEERSKEMEKDLVLELSSDNFTEVVNKYPLSVIDCWAPWCAPCRMVAPVIEELAKDYQGRIVFGKLNVDENPSLAMEYRIVSIPTLLIFKHGQLLDRKIGAMPRKMLEPELTKHIGEK